MPSPICTVKDGSGSPQTTTTGYATVTTGNTVTIQLADLTGVSTWSIECIYGDELTTPASVTSGLTVNSTAKSATFTAPAAGRAMIFRSIINGGRDIDGRTQSSYTTTFKVATPTANSSLIVACTNEEYEHSATYGWTGLINSVIRLQDQIAQGLAVAETTVTLPASSSADTVIYTVPSTPSGAGRLLVTAILIRVDTALVGTGNVVIRMGTSVGGNELLLDNTIDSSDTVGSIVGRALADYGGSVPAAQAYTALLDAGNTVNLRATATGTINTQPVLKVRVFGIRL